MDFKLTSSQQLIKKMVNEFATKELEPIAAKLDEEASFPEDVIKKMAALNLLGILIPTDLGGAGLDTVSYAIVIEELSKFCASTGITVETHNSLGTLPIYMFGTEEQRKKYVPPLAKGNMLGAFAITEPNAGSDLTAMRTTAVLDGDEYVLNGNKIFVTNGGKADVIIVAAVTAEQSKEANAISLFIVDKNVSGLTQGPRELTLGLRAADFSALFFEDCRIPRDNLLGDVGKGLQMIATCLDLCKIGASAHAVGIAQAALDASAEYANTRVQFGKTISKFQAIQWMIADMAMEIDAARLLVYKAAQLRDANEAYSVAAACAKLYASNTAKRATYNAVQIHGGIGYMREYPIERYYRDAKATEFYGGTGELQRINIAKSLINI